MFSVPRRTFTWLAATCALAALSACTTLADAPDQNGIDAGLDLRDSERGVVIRANETILFDFGKAELKPQARSYLDSVARVLAGRASGYQIIIEGHTDNVGNRRANQRLSEARAEAVANDLAQHGIPPARMSVKGYGETAPFASNTTPAGRQQNRRTDVIISGATKADLGAR
ncbi:MAG: Photosystem I P700 chlorophyll a apoprotein A2 [Paracidovorax wautersii]|uniref:Photosystem I P700 chlorophyll a apoprotein A2 n=1 Tax=Paracidovorax wautersii TaxID=1177982 RepID=A0A7V8FLQ6_9BURK|nr:MAG: Photosystem I P700 chlorophyll a apoprotein A2 [Paracidovorax wautersii]